MVFMFIVFFLTIITLVVGKPLFIVVLICISLKTYDLFICLLSIYLYSLEKCLFLLYNGFWNDCVYEKEFGAFPPFITTAFYCCLYLINEDDVGLRASCRTLITSVLILSSGWITLLEESRPSPPKRFSQKSEALISCERDCDCGQALCHSDESDIALPSAWTWEAVAGRALWVWDWPGLPGLRSECQASSGRGWKHVPPHLLKSSGMWTAVLLLIEAGL